MKKRFKMAILYRRGIKKIEAHIDKFMALMHIVANLEGIRRLSTNSIVKERKFLKILRENYGQNQSQSTTQCQLIGNLHKSAVNLG